MAQGAYDAALKYSKQRKQFGQADLANFRRFSTSWSTWRPISTPRAC